MGFTTQIVVAAIAARVSGILISTDSEKASFDSREAPTFIVSALGGSCDDACRSVNKKCKITDADEPARLAFITDNNLCLGASIDRHTKEAVSPAMSQDSSICYIAGTRIKCAATDPGVTRYCPCYNYPRDWTWSQQAQTCNNACAAKVNAVGISTHECRDTSMDVETKKALIQEHLAPYNCAENALSSTGEPIYTSMMGDSTPAISVDHDVANPGAHQCWIAEGTIACNKGIGPNVVRLCPCITKKNIHVTGDPRAMNLKGEKFNILALGALPFLSISPKLSSRFSNGPLLKLEGTVARHNRCTHTYVHEISLTGAWISENASFDEVGVRVVQGAADSKLLEARLGKQWQPAGNPSPHHMFSEMSERKVGMIIHGLMVTASVARGHEVNWLNLEVAGACALSKEFDVGGLLGNGDHSYASTMPEDCKSHREGTSASFSSMLSFASVDTASDGCSDDPPS
jgi:hypothetical protein